MIQERNIRNTEKIRLRVRRLMELAKRISKSIIRSEVTKLFYLLGIPIINEKEGI